MINKKEGKNRTIKESNQTMIIYLQEYDVLHREIYMEIRIKGLITEMFGLVGLKE